MAFATRQRKGEIAIRLALGARSERHRRLIAGEVAGQVGIGLVAGAALAWWLSGAMRTMVFTFSPRSSDLLGDRGDAGGAAALAAFRTSAPRGIRVDPTVTLREQ